MKGILYRILITLFLITVLLPDNTVFLFGQGSKQYQFKIEKGISCSTAMEKFKSTFNVLIAYSPTLLDADSGFDKVLSAESVASLFEKVCYSFQLDFVQNGNASFLVRSSALDIKQAEEIILHINIEEGQGRQPVSFASVYDQSRQYFAFTDEQGDCFIKIPKSKKGEKLIIHSLAHHDKEFTVDTEAPYQKISIFPDPVKVIPVTINTIKKKLSFSRQQGISLDNTIVEKMASSSVFHKDILRTLQMLPGISAINDNKSSVRIRGANEEATLLMIDNMPVYKADHFYGIFGAFNSWYVKKITLYKNNLPVEFGGRTSGMVKLESDSFNLKLNLNLDINLLNSGIMADIPLGSKFNLKFSGRKTYTDLLNSGLYDLTQRENLASDNKPKVFKSLIISKPKFDFYDLNARLLYKSGKHQFDANIFRSADEFIDKYNISFKNKQLIINEELFKQVSNWENKTFGLNYNYTDQAYEVLVSAFRSNYNSAYNITSNLIRKETTGPVKDTVTILNTNFIRDSGFKVRVKTKSQYPILLGAEFVKHENALFIENDRNPIFEINKSGNETSLFAQASLGNKSGLYFEPALRSTFLSQIDKAYFLPQIYLSYALQNDILFKFSAGKQVQFIRLFDHENALGQKQQFFALSNDRSIPVGIGMNYMAGMWKSAGPFTIDVEAYYRHLDGAIIHGTQTPGLRPAQPNPGQQSFRLFTGESRSYGADFSCAFEKPGFFSLFTYTLSKTENRFTEIFKNQYFPSSEDSRHQVKWVNTFSTGIFDFTASYIGASGRPYLDLSSITNPIERINLNVNDYLKNLPDYHRFDIGTYVRFKLAGLDSRIGVSVFNIFNRVNVKYRQFVFQLPQQGNPGQNPVNTILGSDISQLDRTFNLSFNATFR